MTNIPTRAGGRYLCFVIEREFVRHITERGHQ